MPAAARSPCWDFVFYGIKSPIKSMSNKLFVGGISWSTNEDSLRNAFERFGLISEAVVVQDRETGRSRGFGFVTFEDKNAAQQASREMDGQELEGRRLTVNVAQDRAPRSGGERGGGGGDRRGGGRRGGY